MTNVTEAAIDEEERLAILDTMREVGQITLLAGTREELERAVCHAFVASELYVLAWIGAEHSATHKVEPQAAAGVEEGYLDAIDVTVGSPETGGGPTALALETGETQVIQSIAEDPDYAPWREEALQRGYQSSAAVPLIYEDQVHGVLNLYAPRPHAFEPFERDLLTELGRDIGFAIDVLKTRAALDRSHAFLARTEELANTGGWEYDPSADEFQWTAGAKRLHGVDPDGSLTVEAALADYHPTDKPELEAAIDAALTEDEPFDLTLRLTDQSEAEPRRVRVIGQPATDTDDRPLVRGVLQDVTELKAYEERLAVRNEQLLLLNRIVRHDIRNDMNIVLGWGRELTDHVDTEGAGMLDRILDTSQHVIDLTYALRDFLQTLETQGGATPIPIDLGEVLSEELEKRRSAYPQATFEVTDPIGQHWVWADELLSSVFRNILDNAIVHNDTPDPRVEVAVSESDGSVSVRIADNGPGIPMDRRQAVLGRTEAGLEHPDAGLGLYLVDTLVSQYDGDVRIEDNEPSGTVFVVELRSTAPPPADARSREGGPHDDR